MAEKQVTTAPQAIVERNLQLTGEIMRYLMDNPQIFDALPAQFELVILPDDDPEIRQYNLELLDQQANAEKPIVFARLKSHEVKQRLKPRIFVPLPLAV